MIVVSLDVDSRRCLYMFIVQMNSYLACEVTLFWFMSPKLMLWLIQQVKLQNETPVHVNELE